MTAMVSAELRKLRTIRVTWAMLAAAVVLGAGMAALIVVLSDAADVSGDTGGRLVLSSGGIAAGVMTLLLGIVAAGGEYRHGTIVPTLLATPSRPRVTLAHVAASATAGTAIGTAAVAATLAVGLPALASRDIALTLSGAQLLGIAVGGIAYAALSAALGSALGSLLRNQILAVTLALLAFFVIEPVLTGLIDGYQRYSLTGVRVAMTGGAAESAGAPTGGLPSWWLATILWTAYTALLVAAATAVGARRDIR